jgi:hypothetical protein
MKAMWRAVGVGAAVVSSAVFALAPSAGAHVASGPPDLSCDEASVELKGFPQGSSTITFHITVNGSESTKTTQFTGPSGTAKVTISDLTNQTGELEIEAFASWTVDGGGKSDTTTITEVCHEVPPETQEPPLEVGGVSAERPATAAAAEAVTAEPRFTG